jgi:hypothetical protein
MALLLGLLAWQTLRLRSTRRVAERAPFDLVALVAAQREDYTG